MTAKRKRGGVLPDALDCNSPEVSSVLRHKYDRIKREKKIMESGKVPPQGTLCCSKLPKQAGDYILGPCIGTCPVYSIVQCLGRRKNTDKFYTLKILTISDPDHEDQDKKQGKILLYTEHSLLSFLENEPGVIRQHGLFEDYALEVHKADSDSSSSSTKQKKAESVSSGKITRRCFLVLDCVIPHDYSSESANFVNLQDYVIQKKSLKERDALLIFQNIVKVVRNLHEKNVVHRDLKLTNLVLNRATYDITITNFCLGQQLLSESDYLRDQRGSPAYISPDVLSNKPYLGKPSDMWALGVILFTMLYAQFPFYDKLPKELFRRIKLADYKFPLNDHTDVSPGTKVIIEQLLKVNPSERLTCDQVMDKVASKLASQMDPSDSLQVVPEWISPEVADEEEEEEEEAGQQRSHLDLFNDNYFCSSGDASGTDNKYNVIHVLAKKHTLEQRKSRSKPISNMKTWRNAHLSEVNFGTISCIYGDLKPLNESSESDCSRKKFHEACLRKPPPTQAFGATQVMIGSLCDTVAPGTPPASRPDTYGPDEVGGGSHLSSSSFSSSSSSSFSGNSFV